MTKAGIRVGFTKEQHTRVHQFLKFIRPQAEQELGTPVQVKVNWHPEQGEPHIHLSGASGLEKIIPINDVLAAQKEQKPKSNQFGNIVYFPKKKQS